MQAVHTFIVQRSGSGSQAPFAIYAQLNNGTTVPQYHVEVSESKPNLRISRLQIQPSTTMPAQLPQAPQQLPWSNGSGSGSGSGSGPPYQSPPPLPQGYMPENPYNNDNYCSSSSPMSSSQLPVPMPMPMPVPIGTVSLSSISSKIILSIHDIPGLQMKRPHLLASGHRFSHPELGPLEWKEEDLIRKRFKLVDQNKNVLARLGKWNSQSQEEEKKSYAFLVFVDADSELLDWIVVSGLGAVEYRMSSDKEWEELVEDLFM